MDKRWVIKPYDPKLQKELSDTLSIHPIIAQLLINRQITTTEQAKRFLTADLTQLFNPFLLTDMDRAVERIHKAQANSEKVLIYGDYDVDGVTSSALLKRTLKRLGINAVNYIPHRMEDGYGLNDGIVEIAKDLKVSLIITVDCGISAFAPIEAMRNAGIDVIVIDHHEPDGDKIPKALAVIDPKRSDCLYPFKHLSAVGLVAKLTQAIFGVISEEDLDLVAMGTVADVVSLRCENRIFVKRGLPLIEKSQKPGVQALLEIAKIAGKKMKPYYIGFMLGPRLNASGRMGSANVSLDLLLSEDPIEAAALAQTLETHNQTRQKMQMTVVEEALGIIEGNEDIKNQQILVVHKEGWHKGVLGIVASRIVDKYYRPTIVISVEDGFGTGSARSIEGFHLNEALTSCAASLENYGGHKRAAGLRLREENIEQFRQDINDFARDILKDQEFVATLEIDCEISLSSVDMPMVELIQSMEPHGEGNPAVLFCTRNLIVKSAPSALGKDTLKFWVTDGSKSYSAVGFGLASMKDKIKMGNRIDLAYTLGIDDWNKEPVVQLLIKDIKPRE
ncbi:MAG: single-stranded-DNA-specific exonuclease RecJ [Candidatus Omnitrophica bacterium]|nr:single-stranded-DNA-specific exonuclease RecJ [Candidatus Omnitrophota bacterium]